MKLYVFIDDEEENVTVHCHERNVLVDKIEELVLDDENEIEGKNCFGYLENEIVPLKISNITMFYTKDEKTYASIVGKTYKIKKRLYQVEEMLSNDFIKIDKSCIINKNHIKKFDTSWSGTLSVELDDGTKEYVSRRMIKNPKERMGL